MGIESVVLIMDYIHCRPAQLEQAIRTCPIAFASLGALEWHSDHLPLGFDGLKAESLIRQASEKIQGGIIFPTLYFGAYDTMNFPYTFHFPRRALRHQLQIFVNDLYKMGFRLIILLTGHYPLSHVHHLESLAKKAMKKYPDLGVIAIPEQYLLMDQEYFGDHAAKWESSLGLALFPELTDLSLIPHLPLHIDRCCHLGIEGDDPTTTATKELGDTLVSLFVQRLVDIIQDWVKNRNQDAIKHLYSQVSQSMKSLRTYKGLDRTLRILGMQNKSDLIPFLKWQYLQKGKYIPLKKA